MTLTSKSAAACSGVNASEIPAAAMPALLIRTSMRPDLAITSATARSTDGPSVTSSSTTSMPRLRSALAWARFFESGSRIEANTLCPAWARVSAESRPNPVDAPVMRMFRVILSSPFEGSFVMGSLPPHASMDRANERDPPWIGADYFLNST